ncbi:MAG: NfeD family protein [Candidatus Eiseniibacteriota bacterium]|jgi:membrane-bound serine protease (ClpP class)
MIDQLLLVGMVLLVGYLLLLLELLVIPGFGITGIGGLLCLGAGSYLAVRDFGSGIGAVVVVVVLILTTVTLVGLPRTRYGRAIVHRGSLAGVTVEPSRIAAGSRGVAESDLRPAGIARFEETRESVVTDGDYIVAGSPVRVVSVEGGRVVVELDGAPAGDTGDVPAP